MGYPLSLLVEGNSNFSGNSFLVDGRGGAEVQVVDGGTPFGFSQSFFYLVFEDGIRIWFLLRRGRLGAKTESLRYLEGDTGWFGGAGGGPPTLLALKMSMMEDFIASLLEMMLERALDSLKRAVPMPPSSGLQEALIALLAVSMSALAAARRSSCPCSFSNILFESNLGNLKDGGALAPGESCLLPVEGRRVAEREVQRGCSIRYLSESGGDWRGS